MRTGGSRPWRRTVARVLRRDGCICHICGRGGADSADHIVPHSHGGTDAMTNLKAVHHNVEPKCNRVRGDRPIEVARTELAALTPSPDDWDW